MLRSAARACLWLPQASWKRGQQSAARRQPSNRAARQPRGGWPFDKLVLIFNSRCARPSQVRSSLYAQNQSNWQNMDLQLWGKSQRIISENSDILKNVYWLAYRSMRVSNSIINYRWPRRLCSCMQLLENNILISLWTFIFYNFHHHNIGI